VNKGREAEALKTLAYYHANGNANDPLVQYEFEEIKAAIEFDRNVASSTGWLALFKTPGNRRRMRIIIALAVFSQWSGNGLVSYYLNKVFIAIGITNNNTQLLINGLLNVFNFLIAIVAGFLCERVGRRRLFLTSTLGMLVFWTLQTACFALYSKTGNTHAAHAVVGMIFLFFASYDIAFTPLIVSYTVEILPYALRAKGYVLFTCFISLSVIFNQYVNPIALNKLGWKYYLVYLVWLIFENVFCYFFIIETKNLSLEETAALFDGEEKVALIANKAAENAGLSKHTSEVVQAKLSTEEVKSSTEMVE